ncbi:MAG: ribose-phosphate pyrophosphokinase [Coriobacteriales bacterium]|jgi:ribose-phosphate pyrophosphokinase|nr:ribose-phosphate pyrophosphokinase [Coriobacteriales bacterium]
MANEFAVFSGRTNPELAEAIARELGLELGNIKLEGFANGEVYARFKESVRGKHVFLIQSVACGGLQEEIDVNDSLMELLIMVDAAKRASADKITAVISHFGYSRQDKKSAAREPITAKLVANLLTAAGIDSIIAVDLHQGQIQGFFDQPVNHLTALPIFANYFEQKHLQNICIVSPDVGRAKAAKKLSDIMDADLAIMAKSRPAHNVAEVSQVIGEVKGKVCILNDDMIDTAGSICAGAQALADAGAAEIYACATHGLLSGPAYERLENSVIKEVVVTDTVRVAPERLTGKIRVATIAPLLAQAIHNVAVGESVSELFDPDFQL